MHTTVFTVAALWMTALLGVSVVLVVRARSVLSRVLTLDMLVLILVALLVLWADATGASYYMDAALALALLAFVTTVAAARYHGGDGPFS